MDLIHRQVAHTQALCFYCLISKFPVWLWHLATDIGNSTQHCAATPLNYGTGKKKTVLWLGNGLTVTVSHIWALTLWHSFTLFLRKCNSSHGLFNDKMGPPVPLHDTVQWRMNAIHDSFEDAKNSPCSGATANARKYTQ